MALSSKHPSGLTSFQLRQAAKHSGPQGYVAAGAGVKPDFPHTPVRHLNPFGAPREAAVMQTAERALRFGAEDRRFLYGTQAAVVKRRLTPKLFVGHWRGDEIEAVQSFDTCCVVPPVERAPVDSVNGARVDPAVRSAAKAVENTREPYHTLIPQTPSHPGPLVLEGKSVHLNHWTSARLRDFEVRDAQH